MYVVSFCQLLGKSLEMAILFQIGGKTLAVSVLGGEMVIFLIYKVVRRDFRYWLPLPQGTSLATSLIERVVIKVVHDFTGFPHARHPYEMGGFYWLLNMVLTQTGLFVAIALKEKGDSTSSDTLIAARDYTKIAIALLSLWVVGMLGLLTASEKKFRFTFYSLRTSKQYSRELFDSADDRIRIQIFTDHRSYYSDFEDEIKAWLRENWNRWHHHRPLWFSENIVEQIPLELIPGGDVGGEIDESVKDTMKLNSSYKKTIGRALRNTLGVPGGGRSVRVEHDDDEEEENGGGGVGVVLSIGGRVRSGMRKMSE